MLMFLDVPTASAAMAYMHVRMHTHMHHDIIHTHKYISTQIIQKIQRKKLLILRNQLNKMTIYVSRAILDFVATNPKNDGYSTWKCTYMCTHTYLELFGND